jgi:hypothetical protein
MFLKILWAMAFTIVVNAQNNTRKTGPVYFIANSNGSESVLSVIETKNSTGFHYHLQLNNGEGELLLKSKEIAMSDKSIEPEQLIGRMGNVLWLMTDSLTGYDVHTLDKVVTEYDMAVVNSFMKNNFSKLHNNYLLDEAMQVMYVTAKSGEGYKLFPDLSMVPDGAASGSSPDDYSYEFAADYKLYGKYNLKYAMSCIDSLDNKLFILGSKQETAQALSYFGITVYPERNDLRQLTIMPFNLNGDKVEYSKNKPVTVPQQYLGAAFLLNKFYTTPWRGQNSEHLILYRSETSSKAKLCIAMIDKDGNEMWKYNTGITYLNFTDYLVTKDNLVLWMDEYKDNEQIQHAIYLGLQNGKLNDD